MPKKGLTRFLANARHSGANSTLRLDSDKQIADLLNAVKRIAVLGVSARPERPSHQVFQFLLEQGYDAIPVNPQLAGQTLLGKPVLESITAATAEGPVDMVDVFRDSRFLPEVTQDVLRLGIKALWTQLDVAHPEAEQTALEAGVTLVVDRCPAIEVPRLQRLGLMPAV